MRIEAARRPGQESFRRAADAWSLAGPRLQSLFRKGDFPSALDELRRRIGLEPDCAFLQALSGEIKRSKEISLFSEALEDLERACALEPRRAWLWGYRAKALAQAGRLGDAAGMLDKALRLELGSPWLLAERAFLRAAGRHSGGLDDARAACRLDRRSYEARLALAVSLQASGGLEEALRACAEAIDLRRCGVDAALPGACRPGPWALRFELLRALGRLEEAARSLAQAARRNERLFWEPWEVSSPQGLEAALRQVGAVEKKGPAAGWLHFWQGDLLLRLGRTEESAACLGRAVDLKTGAWALAWRGWARARLGLWRPALADLRRASGLLGPQAASTRLELLAASCLEGLGRADSAETLLADSARRWPASETFVRLAGIRLSLGRAAQADAALCRALELDAGLRPAYILRAKLRSGRGDREGALCDLEQAKRAAGQLEALPSPIWPARAGACAARVKPAPVFGRVCVDPRIELAGLFQTALQRPRRPEPDFCRQRAPELAAYVEEARRRFVPRLGGDLLDRFAKTARQSGNSAFPWLGVTQMMMGLSPAPELAAESPAWRRPQDLALLEGLRRFSAKSGFLDFCSSWSAAAGRWSKPMACVVGREPYARTVSAYLGVNLDAAYDVVLAPLLRDVSLRAILRFEDGRLAARTVFCPLSSEELLEETFLRPKAEDLLWTGWHELLHMRIDAWSEFYAPESESFRELYERLPSHARRKNWIDCFSEHNVRAVTQRMLRLRCGEAAQRGLAAKDRGEGYVFQDALAAALASYESDRARFPTLFDFFPEWMKTWRSQK